MNITANITQPSARDFQVYRSRMNDVEKAPLAERKENAQEWFNDLKDPSLIAQRIDWLLDGSYGYAEYWKALQVLESPRMNRVAALSIMIAALEWSCPQRFAIAAWKQLTPKQKTDLEMEIRKVISDHVDKWSTEEGGKYVAGRCGGGSGEAYDVYRRGKLVDTVWYTRSRNETIKEANEEVRRSLISHDGYPYDITVRKAR